MDNQSKQAAPLTLGLGLILWIAVVAALAGFAVIGYWMKLAPLYAGFLFSWYWSSVDKIVFKLLPATIIGACMGAATSWLAQYATIHFGYPGLLTVIGLIAVALLIQIMNWIPLVFNSSYMLFLTITGAPLLQAGEDFRSVILSVVLASVYFCTLTFVGLRIYKLLRRAPAVLVPEV